MFWTAGSILHRTLNGCGNTRAEALQAGVKDKDARHCKTFVFRKDPEGPPQFDEALEGWGLNNSSIKMLSRLSAPTVTAAAANSTLPDAHGRGGGTPSNMAKKQKAGKKGKRAKPGANYQPTGETQGAADAAATGNALTLVKPTKIKVRRKKKKTGKSQTAA